MHVSQSIPLTSRQQASIAILGLGTILVMGIAACVLVTLALVWAVVHIALITLQASIEVLTILATTYTTADPLIKFLLIAALVYVVSRVYRHYHKEVAR